MERERGHALRLPTRIPSRLGAAFTLIELLVVIAIIALLVSILVPSLQKAKNLAKGAFCLTNLHNIGIATMLYADHHDGFIPRGDDCLWFEVFLPFLSEGSATADYREVRVYRCPSYPSDEQTVCYVDSSWSFRDRRDRHGYQVFDPTRLDEFDRPSDTIYLADNEDGWWRPIITGKNDPDMVRHDVWRVSHLPRSNLESVENGRRVARSRHRDGCNSMFLDGHSKHVRADRMSVDMWRDQWR